MYCYLINNILVKEQFGSREKLSMEMATYTLLNNVLSYFDLKKKYLFGLFCDLQKAFDCVNHDILLAKMEFYEISLTANKSMRWYLETRYQRISMKDGKLNKLSKWEHAKHLTSCFQPNALVYYIFSYSSTCFEPWLLVSNLMHLFIISFHIPLHVSSHIVLIIRRIYCIYTASGSLCVTLLVWPFGAQAVRGL